MSPRDFQPIRRVMRFHFLCMWILFPSRNLLAVVYCDSKRKMVMSSYSFRACHQSAEAQRNLCLKILQYFQIESTESHVLLDMLRVSR
ncbi:hypothetical protein M758_1G128900 [Ceratodon purpureus]|nr:hypothetical protein M758_1G128900 [Ceratodon purpureus]